MKGKHIHYLMKACVKCKCSVPILANFLKCKKHWPKSPWLLAALYFREPVNMHEQKLIFAATLLKANTVVRWEHSVFGQLGPDQFLKLAISHDYGACIGEIIRALVLAGFKELKPATVSIDSLSINLMDLELKSLDESAR
jgi:EAL domain-containing protein (putative c-di-GMP-specific phosphodiesterase class I)